MKVITVIIRVLLGLLFVFSSVAYFSNMFPAPELSGNMKTFNEGLAASGYFMNLLKITELICGLALISGFFVPLAIVVLFPIAINILFVHINLAPEGLPVALFIMLALLYLAWYYRNSFAGMLKAK